MPSQEYEEIPVYTDLSNMNQHHHTQQQQQQQLTAHQQQSPIHQQQAVNHPYMMPQVAQHVSVVQSHSSTMQAQVSLHDTASHSNMNIPKPVFSAMSPAPSLDSLDSSASYSPASSYTSEHDCSDRVYGK